MRRGASEGDEAGRGRRGALKAGRDGCEGAARPDRPKRCTLPITALRVTPPSCLAIWLAERPSSQSFLRISTRSSVQPIALISSPARSAPGPSPRATTQDVASLIVDRLDDLLDIVN